MKMSDPVGRQFEASWNVFPGSRKCRRKEMQKAVICFHGYTSQGLADYGSISNYYLKRGYNVLLVDQR